MSPSVHFAFIVVIIISVFTFHALVSVRPSAVEDHLQQEIRSDDKLQGGLVSAAWEGDTHCESRLQYQSYRRRSSRFRPSRYLIHRLRKYEQVHSACTQGIHFRNGSQECQFVVSVVPLNRAGLGNKMLGLVSTFVYALLSNRVLLIASGENMEQLFCEPFPNSSWLLPDDMKHLLLSLNDSIRLGKGDLIGGCNKTMELPKTAYAYLSWDYDADDTKFFCQQQQDALARQVSWLFVRSNVYHVPSYFYVPSFKAELNKLFPEQEAIFHLLARYLLHPSEPVWNRLRRFYDAYLAQAQVLVGLQLRVSPSLLKLRETYAEDVFRCGVEKKFLPNIVDGQRNSSSSSSSPWTAALVTSLDQHDFDILKEIYLQHDTEDGSHVSVHQPSHEGVQSTGDALHDQKALVDIYLLSFCNVLVTSQGSTFGYVAQGLAGFHSWQMWAGPGSNQNVCSKVNSLDPCFFTFAGYNCDCRTGDSENETSLDNVQLCEDAPIAPGVKLKAHTLVTS